MPAKKGKPAKKVSKPRKKQKKFHPIINKIIGVFFLSLTFLILFYPNYLPKEKADTKTNQQIKISSTLLESKNLANDPIRITIPNADIDLPIVNAKIVNGYWELSENTASYGLGSGTPGTKSNTVIFAHARVGLFYNLKDVKIGDTIYVFSKEKWFRYKVNKITQVFPNQTEVIGPTKSETLTLYTCTGFEDEKRLIVQAVPQK